MAMLGQNMIGCFTDHSLSSRGVGARDPAIDRDAVPGS